MCNRCECMYISTLGSLLSKKMNLVLLFLLAFVASTHGLCTTGPPGTNCSVAVTPNTTTQCYKVDFFTDATLSSSTTYCNATTASLVGAPLSVSNLTVSGLPFANTVALVDSNHALTTGPALTNGQLLVGSTGAMPVAASLTGTANQVTVTPGAGSITLATPQSIHTGASPTFAGLVIAATTNQIAAGVSRTTTISITQPAGTSRVLTVPDPGANAEIVLTQATGIGQTITGTLNLNTVQSLQLAPNGITPKFAIGSIVGTPPISMRTLRLYESTTQQDMNFRLGVNRIVLTTNPNSALTVQDSGSDIKLDVNGINITLPAVFNTGVEYHFSINLDYLTNNITITATGSAKIVGLVYRCGNQLRIGSGSVGVQSLTLIGSNDILDTSRMQVVDHLELRSVGSSLWVARGMFATTGLEPGP